MIRYVLILLLVASPAAAESNPFRWPAHREIAGHISDGLVAGQLVLAVVDAARSDDKKHAFGCLAARNAISLGADELLKRLVHRDRPDHSDHYSFPSEHTWLAAVNARGWRYSLVVGVALGRMGADKHHLTDVAAGAGFGWLTQRVCRP